MGGPGLKKVALSFVWLAVVFPCFAQKPTVDDLLDGRIRVGFPVADARVSWLPGGASYRRTVGESSVSVDAATGKEAPYTGEAADTAGSRPAPRRRRGGVSADSPDNKWRLVTQGGNISVTDVTTDKTRALTTDGSPTILNGVLDWVYDEEVYGRGSRFSFQWSPDSKHLAFLRLDESPVKPFTLLDQLPRQQNAEIYGYPLPGDPNPGIQLFVATPSEGSPISIDLSRYPAEDRLLVNFRFSPDGAKLLYQVQNREQTFLDLWSADSATGNNARLLIHEESKDGWIERTDSPTFLADGTFLWSSERSGFNHLYRYRLDGTLLNPVTQGDWDIKTVLRTDEARGLIFFDANAGSVMDSTVWKARLDGKGAPLKLTPEPGTHRADFSADGAYFFDSFSAVGNPGKTILRDLDGKALRTVSESQLPPGAPDPGIAKVLRFSARDGYPLEGTLLLPTDWKPGQKLGVLCTVYAGPSAPTARNAWNAVQGSGGDQFYARNGIAIWKCDNRSANPRGTKAAHSIYKNMGASEIRDIEDGLKYLIAEGYADPARIGISGWSYGGFMSAYALTHSKMFAAGVAGAPPTDWRLYDTIYTERYMSTPQKNAAGYDSSSCIQAAANLSGKLMIAHGMMDDNVHLQNTVQLVHALEVAGKDFELCLYPGKDSRHGLGDRDLSRHQRRKAAEFLLENLAGK